MNFEHSDKVKDLIGRLEAFMDEHIYPNEERFFEEIDQGDRWEPPAVLGPRLVHRALVRSDEQRARTVGAIGQRLARCPPLRTLDRVGDRADVRAPERRLVEAARVRHPPDLTGLQPHEALGHPAAASRSPAGPGERLGRLLARRPAQ